MSHAPKVNSTSNCLSLIAEGEDLRAQIHECGSLQIHLGPMSLRFSEKSFERYLRFLEKLWLRVEERKAGLQGEGPDDPSQMPMRLQKFARMLAGDEA